MSFYPDIECIIEDFLAQLDFIEENEDLDGFHVDAVREIRYYIDQYAADYHDHMEETYQYYNRYTYDPDRFIDDEIATIARLNSGR